MTVRLWFRLIGLLLLSLALALLELLYLPLRFDGAILPMVGGLPFPITAIVALVTLPWLIKRAHRISPRLAIAGSPLWIWLLCVFVAAFPGPGGDVVLIGDWRALLLLACGALAGSITLGGMAGRQPYKV
ncbi:hypothetical protein LWC34_37670 [Kibdelosporangium philippinense]|uniref:Uncharacterized protein n=1 Tax=Kibdelosporangium philippinense TaxID=211113 RepID=A0ABS8ZNH0_9PSEU|nr:hypothetical protein [Kibdelosporangium philippinense]MCE7008500.1 hypothetical protein [Kibdelosporangium philippinense]